VVRRRRGTTILESVAAIALAIVLIPALLPSIQVELSRVTELYEREAVRLILEGELAREAEGATAPVTWASARRLPGLSIERRRGRAKDGLEEVTVTASWRSRALGGARRSMDLTTWVRGR